MTTTEERSIAPQLKLRHLLETIVLTIGRRTEKPEIEHIPNSALFTLAVNPHDQGRFIGKLGATIWAVQTIFWYAGLTQLGWSYSVKLLEPDEPIRDRRPVPLKFDKNWPRKKIANLVGTIVSVCLPLYCNATILEKSETIAMVNLELEKYLRINLSDPSFVEAFETIMRTAGMSNGVKIETNAIWK